MHFKSCHPKEAKKLDSCEQTKQIRKTNFKKMYKKRFLEEQEGYIETLAEIILKAEVQH